MQQSADGDDDDVGCEVDALASLQHRWLQVTAEQAEVVSFGATTYVVDFEHGDHVVAFASTKNVGTPLAADLIVAGAASHVVVAVEAVDDVSPDSAFEDVVAVGPDQDV